MGRRRTGSGLTTLFLALIGCGDASEPATTAADAALAPAPLSGTYDVKGLTVDQATGSERNVTGSVVIEAEADSYTASFHLATTLVNRGESRRAEIVGTGSGSVKGRTLTGTAETQMIVAQVPGVDAGFAMLPRVAKTRILNRSTAVISPVGALRIEIVSDAAPGTSYSPSRTTLRGRRGEVASRGDSH